MVLHGTALPGGVGFSCLRFAEAWDSVHASVVEEYAIFRALEVAKGLDLGDVRVRSDHNDTRRRLKRLHASPPEDVCSALTAAMLRLAAGIPNLRFSYQARRKNHEAHLLARYAAQVSAPHALVVSHLEVGKDAPTPQASTVPIRQMRLALRERAVFRGRTADPFLPDCEVDESDVDSDLPY